MTIGLLAAFLGVVLIDAAIRGVRPWCPLVEAFGGACEGSHDERMAMATTGQHIAHSGSSGSGELTARAEAFRDAVERQYPQANYLGGFSCRTIRPHGGGSSDQWSEHAWANAVDFGGSADVMRRILVFANLNRNRYGINNIIPPGSAVNAVHVDFMPGHSGQTPPCAGGGQMN